MKLIIACRCPKVLLLRFFNAIFVPVLLIFSQNAGNGISETPELKNLRGACPRTPLDQQAPARHITQITGKN
jgi:hypothetical protein